jgi:MFS transporter, DHA1 family, tetracycline resistance protein
LRKLNADVTTADSSEVLDSKAPKSSNTALTFIFLTILIDVIGIGIIIPVGPRLIETLTGQTTAEAGLTNGLLMMAFAAMQFLFSPVLGELSDRFGRRPLLLIALLGLGIDYVFCAFAPTLAWLFVGRILAGIAGASFTVASAYIADVSTPENKAKNFGLIGAAFGLGFILGPTIGGIAAQWGVKIPFLVAAGFSLLNFFFGLFFVPESLPKNKRRPVRYTSMIPGVSLVHLGKYKSMLGLIIAFVLVALAGQVMPVIWTFFTKQMYGWEETAVGISLSVVGLLVGLVQAVLVGILVKKFGSKKVIQMGFVMWAFGMLAFCFAVNEALLYAALIPYILGGMAGPTVQGIMSNAVPENEQGNLQGALTQVMSLAAVASPFLFSGLFYTFSSDDAPVYFPAAPFAAGALIMIIAAIIAFVSLRSYKDPKPAPAVMDQQVEEHIEIT